MRQNRDVPSTPKFDTDGWCALLDYKLCDFAYCYPGSEGYGTRSENITGILVIIEAISAYNSEIGDWTLRLGLSSASQQDKAVAP